MARRQFGYRALRYHEHGSQYEHAEIEVYAPNRYGDGFTREPLVRLTWQADRASTDAWYAFRIEVTTTSVQELSEAAQVARRILGPESGGAWFTPSDALDRLEKIATEVVWDPRISKLVPRDEVPDPEASLYGDDYAVTGTTSIYVGVLARDPESAKTEIAKELATRAASDSFRAQEHAEYLARWIAAGRPVRRLEGPFTPPPPAREKLARHAETVAAVA